MRATVLDAEVGDEQSGADPTTIALQDRVAALLGKEAAVFLPSGTMCNEIAIRVHTQPGEEIIAERSSHVLGFEAGGPAALSGVMTHAIDGQHGRFAADQAERAIRPISRYMPVSRLLCVEQTTNLSGGGVWPVEQIDAVAEVAHTAGLITHMDGARLLNAVIASGKPASRHAQNMDSVWIDLTKGLGAPVGAVLAGTEAFIQQAWTFKQQWGGSMRQSGVIAAMGIYALDHNVDRLAEDHTRAQRIATALTALPGVATVLPADSNIVIFDTTRDSLTGAELVAAAAAAGIRIGTFADRRCRIVTHLDVDDTDVDRLLEVLETHLGG